MIKAVITMSCQIRQTSVQENNFQQRVKRSDSDSMMVLTVIVLSKPTQSMTMSGPSAKTDLRASTVPAAEGSALVSKVCLHPNAAATGKLSGLMSVIATLLAENALAAAATMSPAEHEVHI